LFLRALDVAAWHVGRHQIKGCLFACRLIRAEYVMQCSDFLPATVFMPDFNKSVSSCLAVTLLLLLAMLSRPVAAQSAAGTACGAPDAACMVDDGSYQVFQPSTLPEDGSAIPMLLNFHGYRGTGNGVIGNRQLRDIAERYGLLLIAPNGRNRTWAHNGSPSRARDELAFIDSVVADVEARWPVDPARIYVAGFSQGGSMVWDLICKRPNAFAGFAPISGAFWEPYPESCDPAAGQRLPIIHFHGTADRVVPMAGRPIGQMFQQGDVGKSLSILRATHHCAATPVRKETVENMVCEQTPPCDSGAVLQLCLHGGGHIRPRGWFDQAAEFWGLLPVTTGAGVEERAVEP
tara:strand:+ start:2223 stop:3266 length:1044 start_codon:yes stop_codon:yes gene_type:complete